MTARGAADFLTRATAILGGLFIVLSIGMAGYAGVSRKPPTLDASLANSVQTSQPAQQQQPQQQPTQPQNQQQPSVPLAQ
jgi:preprotein translocase subunit SecG